MLALAIVAAMYAVIHLAAASERLDAWINQALDQLTTSQLDALISEENER